MPAPSITAAASAAPLAPAARAAGIAALAAAACALACLLSPDRAAPLLWPATGLAFALGWSGQARWAAAAALGAAAWRLADSASLAAALAAFAATLAGPLAAVASMRRLSVWKPVEHRLDETSRFLLAALLLAAPIGATIAGAAPGVAAMAGVALADAGPAAAQPWVRAWLADALGIVLVGPVAIAALTGRSGTAARPATARSPWTVDGAALLGFLALAAAVLGLAHAGHPGAARALLPAVVPLAAVLALRAEAAATAATLLAGGALLAAARLDAAATPAAAASGGLEPAPLLLAAAIAALLLQAVAADRHAALARVARVAREDLGTGLLNDRGLLVELGEHLASPRRVPVGLVGVHFGNFDAVAELCGTIQSMHLEQSTAALLSRQPGLRLAARLAAGRYALAVEADSVAQVRAVARELYSALNGQVFRTEHGSLRLTASIGGLLIERHALISAEDCVSALADAMAIAASVRDPQLFVEPLSQTMIDARRAHQEKIQHIREAIREGRIELHAQPLDDLDRMSDRMEYEVLTRLRDRDGSLIPPFEFMPLAVQAQLTVALDRAVIRAVFAWLAQHPAHLARTNKCSINLSGASMADPGIVAWVREQRERHGIAPAKIVFEVTESEAIRNPASAARLIEELKAEGFGIALDDFGTGLATFEYLKRFPLDYLKIDGSFIRNLATSPIDEEIVQSTIRVARRLRIRTIAEHVHSEGVLARLQALGVDHVQGELIGAPRPIAELFETAGVDAAR